MLAFEGRLPDEAIDQLAELLLRGECELCTQRSAEHFADTPWGERHICAECKASLKSEGDDVSESLSHAGEA